MNCLIVIFSAALIAIASAQGAETFDFEFPDIQKLLDEARIVNGSDAKLGQFPHQVSLRHAGRNRHFCGASIINSRWLVTAAHCSFVDFTPVAVVGAHQLNAGGKVHKISKIIPHPEYQNQKSLKFDIALWQTAEEIVFDDNVRPIALPTADTPADAPLTVSGWGRTSVRINFAQNNNCIAGSKYTQIVHFTFSTHHHPAPMASLTNCNS